jgi:hypothetical protein
VEFEDKRDAEDAVRVSFLFFLSRSLIYVWKVPVTRPYDFLSSKNDVSVPSKRNKHKK